MNVEFGLDAFIKNFPLQLQGKKIGIVCHAASVTSSLEHCIDALSAHPDCRLGAIFGPQHGLFGQTQDNMIEWEGATHPDLHIPVYSLYGTVRKPTPAMLEGLDALVIDLQDVGARPYTYLWTLKHSMEACREAGKSLYVLDRPNPVGCVAFDGPMLNPDYFSFVGGAEIPLCHRLTIGEVALLLQQDFFPDADLHVVWMNGWWRNSLFTETGLPWVLPSPNMPTVDTAVVYPGMVLLEATNLSEGRGTTRPFELFGAPYLRPSVFLKALADYALPACIFREHDFIPTFQKWHGVHCTGVQIHVTNPRIFRPVETTAAILLAAQKCAPEQFQFKDPPYEYEHDLMPFDILSGSDRFRKMIIEKRSLCAMHEEWELSRTPFEQRFHELAHYPEERS